MSVEYTPDACPVEISEQLKDYYENYSQRTTPSSAMKRLELIYETYKRESPRETDTAITSRVFEHITFQPPDSLAERAINVKSLDHFNTWLEDNFNATEKK